MRDIPWQAPLFQAALTHPSYAFEHGLNEDNQRLEFLGDAVLGLVVGEWVYRRHPGDQEGRLTKERAFLIRKETLARVAKRLNIQQRLRLSRGEEASGGRTRTSSLADALEAVLGAHYLMYGLELTQQFIEDAFADELRRAPNVLSHAEPKSALQELLQASGQQPTYEMLEETGPPHARVFRAAVLTEGKILGKGRGKSKKAAEAAAAFAALRRLERKQAQEK